LPISRDELDAGGEPAIAVLDFLREQADRGYTFGELVDELGRTDVTLDDLDFALRRLVENAVIETQALERRVYYMYRSLGQ
jgi:hypothetical protein